MLRSLRHHVHCDRHHGFGCLAAQAERFRGIIREQFVRMYEENDVLVQVLAEARKDLQDPKALPDKGSLDIKDVLNAEYAFA
jgi:DNA-directed RNA polymerase, mitochondrial